MDVGHENDLAIDTMPALAADERPHKPTHAQLLTELHAMGA